MSGEHWRKTALEVHEEIVTGSATAREVCDAILERLRVVDEHTAALAAIFVDSARAAADAVDARRASGAPPRALEGIPFTAKVNIATTEGPTHAGSRFLEGHLAVEDATAVARLKAAGAILVGKTHCDEFAMGSSNENSAYGGVRNPWDPSRVPGGSSGGAAAVAAAVGGSVHLGSDTGGSIRQPAAYCGVTGIKPTYGTVSRRGLVAFGSSLDQIGPIARDARDAARFLEVMAGADTLDGTTRALAPEAWQQERPRRIGVPREFFADGIEASTRERVEAAIEALREDGAEVVEVELPLTRYANACYQIIATAEASTNLSRFDGVHVGRRCDAPTDLSDLHERSRSEGFGAEVRRRIILGTFVLSAGHQEAYYRRAMRVRRRIADDFAAAFQRCDVLIGPVSPVPAFRIGERVTDPLALYACDILTVGVNLAGIPALSVPGGSTPEGLPVGVQILGPPGGDATVLAAARRFQELTDHHRPLALAEPSGDPLPRPEGPAPRRLPAADPVRRADVAPPAAAPSAGGAVEREMVIGLEVHVQLATATKLFCACPNRFGDPPNTNVCPICLGHPGALPVLQQGAVRGAVRAGLAFGCTIDGRSRFDRKNYFYPDLPKGYQITQFERPYAIGGAVEFELDGEARSVPLTRIHIEEDAGKSIHEGGDRTRIDVNRCGTPLLEMVTEPTIRSAEEAATFLRTVRDTMRWLGVSDANMEEGSLRCDVNLSLRPEGSTEFGTRTELKNLNSFNFVEQAIAVERARQEAVLDAGGTVVQETRLFDPERGVTASMRGKEEAHDYRYCAEPDVRPVSLSDELIAAEREGLPELPLARRRRYATELGLPTGDARVLTALRGTSEYFEGLLAAGVSPREAANWIQSEVLRAVKDLDRPIEEYPIPPRDLAAVIAAVAEERISVARGRELLATAARDGTDVPGLLAQVGEQVNDDDTLAEWIEAVVAENPAVVAQIEGGDPKPLGFFTGQVMKRSGGKANPKRVTALLRARFGL
jgi:aspartyl-tRNA(Asn)/glutamyl-tRNA(Gln) amidotransferase subunit B